jgi:hypothetical protein
LFNPADGLVAKAYPTRSAREAFVKTKEYRKIRQLISEARQRHGLVEGATPISAQSTYHSVGYRGSRKEGIRCRS